MNFKIEKKHFLVFSRVFIHVLYILFPDIEISSNTFLENNVLKN